MSDPWSERAELYRTSAGARSGPDLDLVVEWAAGVRDRARRRDRRRPRRAAAARGRARRSSAATRRRGWQPDVICSAEDLPFADASFDLARARASPRTTSPTSPRAVARARPASPRERVVVVDTPPRRRAARARPRRSATRRTCATTPRREWRGFFAAAGLERRGGRASSTSRSSSSRGSSAPAAPAPTAARGARAARRPDRRRRLIALERIALRARQRLMAILVDRETRLARPGPDRQRGPLPRPAQPRVRHERRRRRHARARRGRTSRGSPSSARSPTPSPRPARTPRSSSSRRRFAADAVYEAVDAGIATVICITEHIPVHDMLRLARLRPRARRDADRPELPGRALAGQGERRDHPGRGVRRRAGRPRLALGHADLPDRLRARAARARQLDDRRHRRRSRVGSSLRRHPRPLRGRPARPSSSSSSARSAATRRRRRRATSPSRCRSRWSPTSPASRRRRARRWATPARSSRARRARPRRRRRRSRRPGSRSARPRPRSPSSSPSARLTARRAARQQPLDSTPMESISFARGVPAPECLAEEELADCARAVARARRQDDPLLRHRAPATRRCAS